MRNIFIYLTLSIIIILVKSNCVFSSNQIFGSDITIHNYNTDSSSWASSRGYTKFDAGPSTGNILNAHYFPGLLDYQRGNYLSAFAEMNYCLERTEFIKVNPRGFQYLSAGYYLRGMIYLYHASGDGRHVKAKDDFEQAIHWDPSNYYAYLELARLHAAAGSKEHAAAVLQQLLASKPPEDLARQARQQLNTLKSESSTKKR